ncbi:MAG: aryl-sulfate sulfotransferase [Flavobacteriaceae bacterium]|nr:aryl-sulfate sulfotransferase [Flavobacteriaceae bacterium]
MTLKVNQPFVYCSTLILFALIFIGCNEQQPKAQHSIQAVLNPYRIAPLTAVLNIKSDEPCTGHIQVLGETPIENSFEIKTDSVSVPVLGLYPNTENSVVVTLKYATKEVIDTVKIKTNHIPIGFPEIEINKIDRNKMEPGLHGCDIHYANNGKFNSIPMIFDDQGKVRWYLDLSFNGTMVSPFQRLKDGTLLMVDRFTIYEFNMLGQILSKTKIDNNYGMHHDVVELPNGDLLVCIGTRDSYINLDGETILSDSDFIMHYDRKNKTIAKKWDLAKHLDVTRNDVNFLRKGDWLHMNGLAFDAKDSTIVVSGKNQGLVKISWNDELKWIMAPKKNWGKSGRNNDGISTKPFLLTAINPEGKVYSNSVQQGVASAQDFDFPWGPHAPELLPNGNLLVFDNGSHRNFNEENHYSRAVEYKINESNKTVEQIWQYGKERGDAFYSEIVSDVDYLPISNNILVTSGFLTPDTKYSAKIVEVNHETGEEVFEATLYYKTLRGNKTGAWGQSDILYRSERMELKY